MNESHNGYCAMCSKSVATDYCWTSVDIIDDQLMFIYFCSENCKEVYYLTGHMINPTRSCTVLATKSPLIINKD